MLFKVPSGIVKEVSGGYLPVAVCYQVLKAEAGFRIELTCSSSYGSVWLQE